MANRYKPRKNEEGYDEYLSAWAKMRAEVFEEATKKFGPLGPSTLKDFQDYTKEQTKLWKKGKR
jgi:hypothetical protein